MSDSNDYVRLRETFDEDAAQYDRAKLLWVPNFVVGVDYFGHAGLQQNFAGQVVGSTRDTFMLGLGPNVVFAFSDAVYAPLASRQELKARQFGQQTAINDISLNVAEAYFDVQQARGELAGALLAVIKGRHARFCPVNDRRSMPFSIFPGSPRLLASRSSSSLPGKPLSSIPERRSPAGPGA